MDLSKYRKEFPILEKYAYLNTARFCALPNAVIDIQKKYLDGLSLHGSWQFQEWIDGYESARSKAASLIGTSKDQIFFIPNVSTGINLASLYLKSDEVVTLQGDFPSVTLPWTTNGHKVKNLNYLDSNFYDQLHKALKPGNKILSISWVQSHDGFEVDLEQVFEWCKTYEITLVLDGTQGLGAIPFQVDPEVSMVFLSSCFKWLISGYGIAIGYVSEDLLPTFKAFQGWNSIDFGTGMAKTGAASMEVGNAMFLNGLALNRGLEMMEQIGVDNILQHNLMLRDNLEKQLHEEGKHLEYFKESRSSICRMKVKKGDYDRLVSNNIQTSNQGSFVRLSPHFYNDEKDNTALTRILGHNHYI